MDIVDVQKAVGVRRDIRAGTAEERREGEKPGVRSGVRQRTEVENKNLGRIAIALHIDIRVAAGATGSLIMQVIPDARLKRPRRAHAAPTLPHGITPTAL